MTRMSCIVAFVAGILLLVIGGVLGCAAPQPAPPAPAPAPAPAPPPEEVTEWKYLTVETPGSDVHGLMVDFANQITEASGGRLKVTAYPLGELPYTGADAARATRDGLIQMCHISVPFVIGDIPMAPISDFPFLERTEETRKKYNEVAKPYLVAAFDNWGVEVVGTCAYGRRQLITRDPVSSLDDLKGKKIRCAGGIQPEVLRALGIVPMSILFPEVYTAFSRGVIDGVLTASRAHEQIKTHEPGDYFFKIDGETGAVMESINKDAWNALPQDIRDIITRLTKEFTADWDQKVLVDWEEGAVSRMLAAPDGLKAAVEITEEDWLRCQKATLPILDDYVTKNIGPDGLAAFKEILKALNIKYY